MSRAHRRSPPIVDVARARSSEAGVDYQATTRELRCEKLVHRADRQPLPPVTSTRRWEKSVSYVSPRFSAERECTYDRTTLGPRNMHIG